MCEIILKEDVFQNINKIKLEMEDSLFIYPTDTIYGIGCDATNSEQVRKLREVKGRFTRPFSIIPPSINWIEKNCEITSEVEEWIKKLPGPYTLILKLKNKSAIADNINEDDDTIGIRLPKHWMTEIVSKYGKPIITTSVNKMGQDFMTSLDNLDEDIKNEVKFIINEEHGNNKPSTIINLTKQKPEIIER